MTASKRDQERAALHLQIGTGYLSAGQYPLAITELLKAEQLDPQNPSMLNNLGLAYYVNGRLKQAEEKFRGAIKYKSDYSDAKNNLARVLIDQQKFEEAIRILSVVENDLTYHYPEKTLSNLGMAYFQLGQYKRAEDLLARSLLIRRESCTTAHFYGRTLLELKRLKDSAQVLDNAVEYCRSTKFEDPLFFSAMSYFSLGEKEKSRARLDELLKDYPKSKYVAKAKGLLELLAQ
ncbi:MAG: tetratricopeptide repeat protein [Bdellovibrionales bacterium]|nr:tetratricopeptide repeat protein [Bdellovibrionales bacterium]